MGKGTNTFNKTKENILKSTSLINIIWGLSILVISFEKHFETTLKLSSPDTLMSERADFIGAVAKATIVSNIIIPFKQKAPMRALLC